jgi:hypothetical protein
MKKLFTFRTAAIGALLVLSFLAAHVLMHAAAVALGDTIEPPPSPLGATAFMLLFSVPLFASYAFTRSLLQKQDAVRVAWKPAAVICVALVAVALVCAPAASDDSVWNAFMAKVVTTYHANPYIVAPSAFSSDPLFTHVSMDWRDTTMVYGPLWTMIAAAAVLPAKTDAVAMFVLRALSGIAYVAAGFVLYAAYAALDKKRADAMLAVWLVCAYAIFETANNGHNEGALVLALAVAAAGMFTGSIEKAMYGLTAAFLIKIWPAFLFVALLGMAREKPRRAAVAAIGSAAAVIACSLPFGGPFIVFSGLGDLLKRDWPNMFSPFRGAAYLVTRLAGLQPFAASVLSYKIAISVFIAVVFIVGWRTWSKKIDASWAALMLCLACFGIFTPFIQPWHLVGILPFIIFTERLSIRTIQKAVLGLSFLALWSYYIPAAILLTCAAAYFTASSLMRRRIEKILDPTETPHERPAQ